MPQPQRGVLLFWGIVLALGMRGVAIVVGVELIERFHLVVYILGATLLVLAWRILRRRARGRRSRAGAHGAPRAPGAAGGRALPRRALPRPRATAGASPRRCSLALAAVVAADIAFAVDSIPAALAITRDPVAIWTANAFALLGLRALLALVDIRPFRYVDKTIALILTFVGVKLLIEDLYKVGPIASLTIVLGPSSSGSSRRSCATVATRRAPPSAERSHRPLEDPAPARRPAAGTPFSWSARRPMTERKCARIEHKSIS